MSGTEHAPHPAMSDRVEFELRLVPGVVAVGMFEGRLSIAATSPEAAERAEELARARLGDDADVDTVTPHDPVAIPPGAVAAILELPGVRTCSARRAVDGAVSDLEVTVDSVRAADAVHDLVTNTFGAAFARERLQVALEIPLTADAGA